MKMDRQPGDENREIKIDAGKRSETEGDRKQIKLLHEEPYSALKRLKELKGYKGNHF